MSGGQPRVVLVHALRESQVPAWEAFAANWPEARIVNLLDDSLSADVAADGGLTPAMVERFLTLGRYAQGTGADGILFTCSAFGPAIAAVKRELPIPVLAPNEAAFEAAVAAGPRIALMVTFPGSVPPLRAELDAIGAAKGQALDVTEVVVQGALAALQAGGADEHDRLIAEAAARLADADALVLGQFSMARAAARIPSVPGRAVITTPDSAVRKLRRELTGAA